MKRKWRLLCLLMSVIIMLLALPLPVMAVENEALPDEVESSLSSFAADTVISDSDILLDDISLGEGEKSLAELQAMSVDLESIPEFINSATALEKQHVNRLFLQERSTTSVIYQNKDGTRSEYIFAKPVKYIDADGNMRDKSTKLSNLAYSYEMNDNSVGLYLPKLLSEAVTVSYENYEIGMFPISDKNVNAVYDSTTNSVIYSDIFGRNTLLRYTPNMYGVKEDIVLVKNIGENEFEFELTIPSTLTPELVDGVWVLKDKTTGKRVADLGRVIINDSADNSTVGEMTLTQANGKYIVKITAPESFLNDSNTVYPVIIDPTVTIEEERYIIYEADGGTDYIHDYVDTIVDIGLYNNDEDLEYALNNTGFHKLGYTSLEDDDFSTVGRIMYKLYDFYGFGGAYVNLKEYAIGSAKLCVTPYSPTTTEYIMAAPMTACEEDNSTIAVKNDTLWNAYSFQCSVGGNGTETTSNLEIDITEIVKSWARFNAGEVGEDCFDPANGFALMPYDGTMFAKIYSCENSVNNIYVLLDKSDYAGAYYISTTDLTKYLNHEGNKPELTVGLNTEDQEILWWIEYLGNNEYYIGTDDSLTSVLRHTATLHTYLSSSPPTDHLLYRWKIVYDSGCKIKNAYTAKCLAWTQSDNTTSICAANDYGSGATLYNRWRLTKKDSYRALNSFRISNMFLNIGQSQYAHIEANPYNTTWQASQSFTWQSNDTSIATVDDYGRITGVGVGATTIKVSYKADATKEYKFYVVVGQFMPNGTYYIKSPYSNRYLKPENGTNYIGANMRQSTLSSALDVDGQWIITYDGSGYYKLSWKNNPDLFLTATVVDGCVVPTLQEHIIVSGITDSSQLWFLCKQAPDDSSEDYGLRIMPSAYVDEDFYLTSPNKETNANVSIEETNVVLEENVITNMNQTWVLGDVNKSLVLTIYYDEGFVERYSSFDKMVFKIIEVIDNVSNYYAYCFNIHIYWNGIGLNVSEADTCVHEIYQEGDALLPCSCDGLSCTDNTYHHKNLSYLLHTLPEKSNGGDAVLGFTGHNTCGINSEGVHESNLESILGMATSNQNASTRKAIVKFDFLTKSMTKTTIHEVGHLFGIPDHYYEGGTDYMNDLYDTDIYDSLCVYGEDKALVGGNVPTMCEGCREHILSQASYFATH